MVYIQKEGLSDDLNQKVIEIRKSEVWKHIKMDDAESIRQVFDNEFPKSGVKEVLIREQRGLCAYCMRRIRMDSHSRIEHFIPLSPLDKMQMDKIAYKPDGTIFTEPIKKNLAGIDCGVFA